MEAYRHLAKVYDLMMDDVDYDAWAAYLHGLLRRSGAKRIFEAACGTGELTQRLYDFGYDITASDLSEEMLRTAAEKARKRGRAIRYVRQDLRRIEVARPVDAVICACDGVNYVDSEGTGMFARSAYAALKPGGLLLFDISTRYKLQSVMDGQVWFDDAEDAACIWTGRFDESAAALTMDVTVFARRGELFERFGEQHVQYAHDIGALSCTLADAGFSRASVYEALSENTLSKHAQRAQFVCVR